MKMKWLQKVYYFYQDKYISSVKVKVSILKYEVIQQMELLVLLPCLQDLEIQSVCHVLHIAFLLAMLSGLM